MRLLLHTMIPRPIRVKLAIVLASALVIALLLGLHAHFMNGPYYWKWPWRRLDAWRYFPAMIGCGAPLIVAAAIHRAGRFRTFISIALVMISMLAMQIVHISLTVKPASLDRIIYFVESPMSTSYYADAVRSMDHPVLELIANYPAYMPQFYMHGQEKPPGPILFFRAIIGLFGVSDHTALIAGIIIGLLATVVVPATYLLIRAVLQDRDAAFAGCVLIALCPGLTLHFPMMDQLYPIITCALLGSWVMALRTGKGGWSILFGVILSAACFVVFHFLVLGIFLAAATIAFSVRSTKRDVARLAKHLVNAIGLFCIIHFLLLDTLLGYHPFDVFQMALIEQHKHLASLVRPYPRTILFDLTDFTLGAAWLPCILAMFAIGNRQIDAAVRRWGALCLAQIVLLALIGLMQAETARIWCFLLPLLMLPAAAELSRWPRGARIAVYAAMLVLLCLVGQNLTFMY